MRLAPIWLMQPIPYFGEEIHSGWIFEPKIDGWRMQIICNKAGKLECWGRRLERKPNWTSKLHYLLALLEGIIPPNTLLDCELYSDGGRRFIPSLFARKPRVRPIVYIFDVVYLCGKDLSKRTLKTRKESLAEIPFNKPFFRLMGKTLTNIKRDYSREVNNGHEGIVMKKLNSRYLIGKEAPIATQDWRKIK
ncbi:MAG: hypothetical protein JSU64_04895 [candidate division WOR-3 bacterium]|nr:MAG: hypothetical protein JSU64_04895 [candidate division WOR-3 bacterium]